MDFLVVCVTREKKNIEKDNSNKTKHKKCEINGIQVWRSDPYPTMIASRI